jgi:hypothetical protein
MKGQHMTRAHAATSDRFSLLKDFGEAAATTLTAVAASPLFMAVAGHTASKLGAGPTASAVAGVTAFACTLLSPIAYALHRRNKEWDI